MTAPDSVPFAALLEENLASASPDPGAIVAADRAAVRHRCGHARHLRTAGPRPHGNSPLPANTPGVRAGAVHTGAAGVREGGAGAARHDSHRRNQDRGQRIPVCVVPSRMAAGAGRRHHRGGRRCRRGRGCHPHEWSRRHRDSTAASRPTRPRASTTTGPGGSARGGGRTRVRCRSDHSQARGIPGTHASRRQYVVEMPDGDDPFLDGGGTSTHPAQSNTCSYQCTVIDSSAKGPGPYGVRRLPHGSPWTVPTPDGQGRRDEASAHLWRRQQPEHP